jgi:hypothetical protein
MRQRDIEAPMSGCRLSQQQATPEKQQPAANERLLAARARAPHEAERH